MLEMQLQDEDLWQRYRDAEDREALGELLNRHAPRMRRIAVRMLGSESDADDAMQIAFERLLGLQVDQLEQVRDLRPWLSGLIMNCSRYIIEKESRLRARHQRAYQLDKPVTVSDPDQEIEDEARQALIAMIDSTLQELPSNYQDALVLHYMEGMQFKEVGSALGRSEEAVKKHAQRGIKKMRELLMRRGVQLSSLALCAWLTEIHAAEAPASVATTQLIVQVVDGKLIGTSSASAVLPVSLNMLIAPLLVLTCSVAAVLVILNDNTEPDVNISNALEAAVVDSVKEHGERVLRSPADLRKPYENWKKVPLDWLTRTGDVLSTVDGDNYSLHIKSRDLKSPAVIEATGIYFQGKAHPKWRFSMRINERLDNKAQIQCGEIFTEPFQHPVARDLYDRGFQTSIKPPASVSTELAQLDEGWHDVLILLQFMPNENGKSSVITYVDGKEFSIVEFPSGQMAKLTPLSVFGVDVECRDFLWTQYDWEF